MKQAKTKTIDRYKANGSLYRAWGDVQPDGSTHWMLATHNPIWVFAEAVVTVSRKRYRDLTGYKAYRVVSRATCQVKYRLGYTREVVEFTQEFSLGEKAAVRQLLTMMAADNWPVVLANEVWRQCYQAGVDSDRLSMANSIYCPPSDPFLDSKAMLALLQECTSATSSLERKV